MDMQTLDEKFRQEVEAAKQEILDGLPLIEYLRRTGDEAIDEWASLLAEFGTQEKP
jgi:hypothetical protein